MSDKQTVVNARDYTEACVIIQEIIGDFVCMSNDSPQEVNMADELMRLRNLLLEMEEWE